MYDADLKSDVTLTFSFTQRPKVLLVIVIFHWSSLISYVMIGSCTVRKKMISNHATFQLYTNIAKYLLFSQTYCGILHTILNILRQGHEGRKRHLRRPYFSKGLTKLAILWDYECSGMLCLALPARQNFGQTLVDKKRLNNKCESNLLFFNEKMANFYLYLMAPLG